MKGQLCRPVRVLRTTTLRWKQDFGTDASGWFDSNTDWHGTVTYNAEEGTATTEGDAESAPFSRFDGHRSDWMGN